MADESTSPRHAARTIETTCGVLNYSEPAPLLAQRVLSIEQQIAADEFEASPLGGDFIRHLHRAIAGDLVPDRAGQWRSIAVRVGTHEVPPPREILVLIHNCAEDPATRLGHLTDELLPENLAFAEGRLLSIPPFRDFNGRVTRIFPGEILRRRELPPVDLVPTSPESEKAYFAALRASDGLNRQPLAAIRRRRIEDFA